MRHQHAMEAHMNKSFANFADLASFIAAETGNQDRSSIYEGAFMEHDERATLSHVDATEQPEIPDPEQARAAVEIVMATLDRKCVWYGRRVSDRDEQCGRCMNSQTQNN